MASKAISSLALLITANAQQLTGEFNRVDNVVTRSTMKWQRSLGSGLKMGIGISGAQAAISTINSEIRHVIQNIANIPGIPAEVVTSITEARGEFQNFRSAIDGAIAKVLHFGRIFAQSVGAGAAMLFGGATADDVSAGLGKLPSPDEIARGADPGFDAKVKASAARLREAQAADARARLTPAAQYAQLTKEADRLRTYSESPSINSQQKVDAQLQAQQKVSAANQLYSRAQEESNQALEKWQRGRSDGVIAKMSDSDAVAKLTREIQEMQTEVESLNAEMLSGGGDDIAMLQQRTELYEKLREKQEQLNPILERQRAAVKAVGDAIGGFVTSAFEDAIFEGKKFSDLLSSLWKDLLRLVLRKAILNPIADTISGGFTRLLGFAEGGRPPVGVPSIVGERGPELFVPDSAGTIVPNHALGPRAAAAGNIYHIDARGADQGAVVRIEMALMALAGPGVVERRAVGAVLDSQRRVAR